MKFLALALVACSLVAAAHAYCYTMLPVFNPDSNQCQDDIDKTWHDVGSSWRNSKCMDCSCGGCCTGYSIPRSYPDDCVSEFDTKACEFKVHKKNDPSVSCPIFAAVGK